MTTQKEWVMLRREMLSFMRARDNKPFFFVLKEIRPDAFPGYDYAWIVAVPYDANNVGAPADWNVLGSLHKTEDQIVKVAEQLGGLHIGHRLGSGFLAVVFRSQKRPPVSIEVKTGLFAKSKFNIDCREDPNWDWHKTEMTSTAAERHASLNFQVHENLIKAGDNAEIVRPVEYHLIFPTAAAAQAFSQDVQGYGPGPYSPQGGRYWLVLTIASASDTETIANRCAELEEIASRHGGELDGWETSVEK